MQRSSSRSSQSGFTLIEMIVSLGVFSVVVTIAVGALLILIASNRQLQDEQAILTNLSFALDSMSREIRTGSNYYCDSRSNANAGPSPRIFASTGGNRDVNDLDSSLVFATQDCEDGFESADDDVQGVAFTEGGDSITGTPNSRILYFFLKDSNPDVQSLYRKIGDNPAEKIVSDGIYITDAEFFVTGSYPLGTGTDEDETQASVTIYLEAAASNTTGAKKHYIQTTITQRTLDI